MSKHKLSKNHPLRDFKNFLYTTWKFLNLPDPTPVQYEIADFLQAIYYGVGPKRAIIEAFRGVGKSWMTSTFVCWILLLNPEENVLVVSASKNRADDFTTFCQRLILEMPQLKHLIPAREQRWSKISFDVFGSGVSHAPSVKSLGITGQLTGSRAGIIIADDIEVPNNSMTQVMRDQLAERVKEFDAILKPGGLIIYLGTPQTEMSLYNTLQERGYVARVWPARYPQKPQLYGNSLAPSIANALEENPELVGKPTDPKRFNNDDLLEREASYGRSGFSLQFMLDTTLSDLEKYPLKINDMIVMDINPDMAPEKAIWATSRELVLNDLPNVAMRGDKFHKPMMLKGDWLPYTGSVMFIDPSGRGQDETGIAVVKSMNSQLFVTWVEGLSGGYSEKTLEHIANIAKKYDVHKVLIESNFGDGMFTALLQPIMNRIYPVTLEEVRHNIMKENRIIDTLEPVLNQHRLIVDTKVIKHDFESAQHHPPEKALKYQLIYQLTRITRDKGSLQHDDRLDALAGAVSYWVNSMKLDIEKQIEQRKDKIIDKELKEFIRSNREFKSLLSGNTHKRTHNRRKKSKRY